MGSGSTKLLSYEEACKRFFPSDLERIELTFRDITNGSGQLSFNNFKRDVFGNFLPEKLATRLYKVCMGNSKYGMTIKDLIVCLAIIYYGKSKERMQLLYAIFTFQRSTFNRQVVEEFIAQCGETTPEELQTLFYNDGHISQESFVRWFEQHRGNTTIFTDWLMDDNILHELASIIDDKSDQFAILASVTYLSDKEVLDLERCYIQLHSTSRRQMNTETFSKLLSPVFPPILIPGFFDAFDENQDGTIDFKEFVCGISAACRGSNTERFQFLFKVFDRDHDHLLNKADIIHMASCLIDVAQFTYQIKSLHVVDSPEDFAKNILNENGQDHVVNQEDFLEWCKNELLISELLSLIFQICHVVLGLKPSNKEEEALIIKTFLKREQYPFIEPQSHASSKGDRNRSTTKPGSNWYLINIEWWKEWEQKIGTRYNYSQTNSKNQRYNQSSSDIQQLTTSSPLNKTRSALKLTKNSSSKTGQNGSATDLSKPGDIDNWPLIEKHSPSSSKFTFINDECIQLKSNLKYSMDYEMVPEVLWNFIKNFYRCKIAICRKVTYERKRMKPELELYPLSIKIYRNQMISQQQTSNNNYNNSTNNSATTPHHSMYFVYPLINFVSASMFGNGSSTNVSRHYLANTHFVSPHQTLKSIAEELAFKYGVQLDEVRLWLRYGENNLRWLDFEQDDLTCQQASIQNDSEILFEVRNNDLTWPEELYTLTTSAMKTKSNENKETSSTVVSAGTTGLSNLGNTCFLNAAVQALSYTHPLTHYFLEKYHLFEINKDNPIGMQGNIALRYGQLVDKLWSGVKGPLAPFELRDSVAKFGSSRFTEFQQHDTQEFLSFLLDGLHEDLNRVHHKPYVELKDSDDRPDEDVAKEHWSNHLARNTSIVVDLFHGLLKSQVKCRVCELKSVRFDPFNVLSLPLPSEDLIYLEVKLIRLDGSVPIKYSIKVGSDSTLLYVKQQLADLSSLSVDKLSFFDVTYYSLRRIERETSKVKLIGNFKDLCAYEIPLPVSIDTKQSDQEDTTTSQSLNSPRTLQLYRPLLFITAYHRRLERAERYISPVTRYRIVFFGQPIITPYYSLSSTSIITNKDLYKNVCNQISRLLRNVKFDKPVNHAVDCNNSLAESYPFTLKSVTEDGQKCSKCTWNRFCLGCKIEINDEQYNYTNGTICIDWEPADYYLSYLAGRELEVINHSSIELRSQQQFNIDDPIRLEDCLESFIQWENLDEKETYYCKKCEKHQQADKKLDIWKLPPILIFHVKRFQLYNNRWIKSSRSVRFPIHSFDPSVYLATRTPTSQTEPFSSTTTNSVIDSNSNDHHSSSSSASSSSSPSLSSKKKRQTEQSTHRSGEVLSPVHFSNDSDYSSNQNNSVKSKVKTKFSRNKKSSITPMHTEISKSSPTRFKKQSRKLKMSFGENSFDADNAAYHLYALVCHHGVIGGGHYVAFVKNRTNQQWYCFNDSLVKPVNESVLEQYSSAAYLLFYEREGLNYDRYMPDIDDKRQVIFEPSGDDKWCSIM